MAFSPVNAQPISATPAIAADFGRFAFVWHAMLSSANRFDGLS